ncbi:MAG TPA: carboxypeptidase-like regulatory domain-containing protein [Vicinamibacterales bacterium]|nr:carboxypeptidase-like regulatory domain-containing protein [Vicinamibacterales bacterium]
MRARTTWAALIVAMMAVAVPGPSAQEFRGTIEGTVKDTTGGVLPGVTVTVTNTATSVAQDTVTDASGRYRVLYLNPGNYSVSAEIAGFKKFVHLDADVRVGDVVRVDVVLEAGGVSETVSVTAERSLLNTSSGISGTTIDSKQITELPLGDGTAYMLTRLAPGILDTSDLHFARPADNANLGGIVANGALGGNEFSIDGSPNMSNQRGVGFSPPSDAISQFKVQTNAFDAQTGHTAGAVVNLAVASGTNAVRFAAGYFNRSDKRSETPLLTERNNGSKPTREYNRYTGTLSGPVVRNRTFFMASFEHLRDVQPEPATYTVPTERMRNGDFGEFSTLVYDPLTATSAGVRSPFTDNRIPTGRIDPVAAAYTALYPLPNRPGTVSNYFTNQLRPYDYNAGMGRVDHNFTDANRMYGTVYWNKRQEDRYNWAQDAANATGGGIINGFAVTKGFDYRTNTGVTSGYTSTLSNSTLLDVRGNWSRFGEYRDPAEEFDPASLGFASSAVQAMGDYRYLPFITIGAFSQTNDSSTIASLGSRRSDWREGFDRPLNTASAAATLTRVLGQHTARAGYDYRHQNWAITDGGYPGGRFRFDGSYTRANNSAATNDRAQSFAQFLLGLPTATTGAVAAASTQTSQFEMTSPGEFTQIYHHFFVQDDWQVSPRLTLNLGMRFEINSGMREVLDRNLAGFDTITSNPIEAQAAANYARNPIPEIPVSAFQVNGGLLFADGPVNDTATKWLPRAAAAFMLDDRTVLRGGVGLFSYDYFFENINQSGFSQATPVLTTSNNGVSFTGVTLSNPLPSGELIQPPGSSLGLQTSLGQGLGTMYDSNRVTPYYTRWEMSLQRDFGSSVVGSVIYVGSRGSDLPVVRAINNIPMNYLSTSRSRDAANETYLTTNVPSPFTGLLPGSTINGATVQRQQLLRPFPHFIAISREEYTGSDSYSAVSFQVEKRFRGVSSVTAQYTRSSLRDKLNFLNPQDGELEDRVAPNDRPHRFSTAAIMRLPFGHEQKWGNDWNDLLDAVAGGWQLSTTYQYQSGAPLAFTGNVYFDASCDPGNLKSTIGQQVSGGIGGLDVPAWDVSCFYFHDAPVQTGGVDDPAKQQADQRIAVATTNNVRYFPSTMTGMRTDDVHLLDIGLSKNFRLPRSMTFQIRFEVINALNYTVLWNPDLNPRNSTFGLVNQDRNNPRDIQIGARLTF